MLHLGIVKTFDNQNHRAGVQLAGSLTTYLDDISVSVSIASSAMVVGNYVLVAIPGGNPRDACVVASWPQGSSGGGGGTKIQDADGDTYLWVEKTADEDKIHGAVKGVEAFLMHDDGILDLAKQSGCAVYLGTDQTIPSASHTVVNLDTVIFDTLGEFNTTTHRFTATRAGIYIVIGATSWNNPNKTGYQFAACLKKNGSLVTETIFHSACYWRLGIMTAGIFSLAANDYVELDAYQNTGSSDNLDAGINHTYMHIAKIA